MEKSGIPVSRWFDAGDRDNSHFGPAVERAAHLLLGPCAELPDPRPGDEPAMDKLDLLVSSIPFVRHRRHGGDAKDRRQYTPNRREVYLLPAARPSSNRGSCTASNARCSGAMRVIEPLLTRLRSAIMYGREKWGFADSSSAGRTAGRHRLVK